MQATLEDWDVCPFGLDEIQYQRENDIAFQDYVITSDSDKSKDWYTYDDIDYGNFSYNITDDIFKKYVEHCKQPENKKVLITLQDDVYKITQEIEVVDAKIDKIAKKRTHSPKLLGHLNKHISLLQKKKKQIRG